MSLWEPVSSTLLSVASLLQSAKAEKRNQIEEIKKAVSKAFHHTERYYTQREAGDMRNDGIEFEIAESWEAASILIEPLDSNLANRLSLKSRFWREGGLWSDQQIHDAGIQLDRVRAEGMILVKPQKRG